MNILHKAFTVAAISLLTACSSTPDKGNGGQNDPDVTTDTAPGIGGSESNGVEVIAADVEQASGGSATGNGELLDGMGEDGMRMVDVDSIYPPVIYFAYDQYELNDEGTEVVRYHANILLENMHQKLILNGHTDERGTPEYNLALGEKRAQSVAQAMMLFGIDEKRIEVISFGEEQPADTQSSEAAWQKNRRVDIVIK